MTGEVQVERKPDGSVTIYDGYELVSVHASEIADVAAALIEAHGKNQEQEEP